MDKNITVKYGRFQEPVPWRAMSADQVMSRFETGKSGLSGDETEKRLHRFGLNVLSVARSSGVVVRFFSSSTMS